MNRFKIISIMLSFQLFIIFSVLNCIGKEVTITAVKPYSFDSTPAQLPNSSNVMTNIKLKNLRRADFKIAGSGCAACLLRLDIQLNKTPGIYKAAVMLVKPYGAVVIYDNSTTNLSKILNLLASSKLKANAVHDEPIKTMPTVLIPNIMVNH